MRGLLSPHRAIVARKVGDAGTDAMTAALNDYRTAIATGSALYDSAKKTIDAFKATHPGVSDLGALKAQFDHALATYQSQQKEIEATARRDFAAKVAAVGVAAGVLGGGAAFALYGAAPIAIGYALLEGAIAVSHVVGGDGFSDDWKNEAARLAEQFAAYPMPVAAFDEGHYHSPMGYAKALQADSKVVEALSPADLARVKAAAAAWGKFAAVDPIVSNNFLAISQNGGLLRFGDWKRGESTEAKYPGEPNMTENARMAVEMIGLAAARANNLPLPMYQTVIDAAWIGWDDGIDVGRANAVPACEGCWASGAGVAIAFAWSRANEKAIALGGGALARPYSETSDGGSASSSPAAPLVLGGLGGAAALALGASIPFALIPLGAGLAIGWLFSGDDSAKPKTDEGVKLDPSVFRAVR